jgi:putative phage-type endonuclease
MSAVLDAPTAADAIASYNASKVKTVEAWRAARMTGIGASETASVMGRSPYKTAVELYFEKIGVTEPKSLEDSYVVRRGEFDEEFAAQEYMRQTGRRVRRANLLRRHAEYPFIFSTLDRVVVGERRVVECKVTQKFPGCGEWGQPGSSTVPIHVIDQVMQQMACDRSPVADIPVAFPYECGIFTIPFDESLWIDEMLPKLKAFWACVLTRTYPDPQTFKDVVLVYAQDNAEPIEATREIQDDVAWITKASALKSGIEKDIKARKDRVAVYMGQASLLTVGDATLATFRTTAKTRQLRFTSAGEEV